MKFPMENYYIYHTSMPIIKVVQQIFSVNGSIGYGSPINDMPRLYKAGDDPFSFNDIGDRAHIQFILIDE